MTANPPAVGDDDTFVVRRTIHIRAGIDKVWQAITEPEHISRWFARTELDSSGTGGTMRFAGESDAIPFVVARQEPGHFITYRWNNDEQSYAGEPTYSAETATEFTFTLESADDGTRLTVEEFGFEATSDPTGNLRSHVEGWTEELDKLVRVLEREVVA